MAVEGKAAAAAVAAAAAAAARAAASSVAAPTPYPWTRSTPPTSLDVRLSACRPAGGVKPRSMADEERGRWIGPRAVVPVELPWCGDANGARRKSQRQNLDAKPIRRSATGGSEQRQVVRGCY
eukprot:scaffold118628_cov42-Phaeocystis_antarctica.AAC.1